jgi:membrane protein DedA with SNARE-associated domain
MGITEFLAAYITRFMNETGYITVVVAMAMESMIFPVPSEAVMPFAGFLVADGKFSFAGVICFSVLGSMIGSLLSYAIGYYGGRPFVIKFGKYLLLDHSELEATERFFSKYGEAAIFICRFIPVIRHLISIPAGLAKMNVLRFSIFTFLGAGLWNSILTISGFYLWKNWTVIMKYSKIADIAVVLILLFLIFIFIARHLKKGHK